jgi:hypothetical protein
MESIAKLREYRPVDVGTARHLRDLDQLPNARDVERWETARGPNAGFRQGVQKTEGRADRETLADPVPAHELGSRRL